MEIAKGGKPTVEVLSPVRIEKVGLALVQPLLTFVMRMRKEVFPMLSHDRLSSDLLDIHRVYLEPDDAVFFAAITAKGEVVGSIAALRYDERIQDIKGFYEGTMHSGNRQMLRGPMRS